MSQPVECTSYAPFDPSVTMMSDDVTLTSRRPYLYGLAVDGSAGVKRVVGILRTELEMAMALTGRTSVKAVDRKVLWT